MAVVAPSKTRAVPRKRPGPVADVAGLFRQWLSLRRVERLTAERVASLRDQLMEVVEKAGTSDEKGHQIFSLPTIVVDEDGERWEGLQRQRVVTRVFDEEGAVALLKRHRLWLKPEQLRALEALRAALPALSIDVAPNPDAMLRLAYEGKRITASEFDALFTEKVSYRFVPKKVG